MVFWKPAKGYEDELKISTACEVKNAKGTVISTRKSKDDIVFTHKKKTLSALKIAKETFGENYVHPSI